MKRNTLTLGLMEEAERFGLTGMAAHIYVARGGFAPQQTLEQFQAAAHAEELLAVTRAHISAGHCHMAKQCAIALVRVARFVNPPQPAMTDVESP